MCECGGGGSKAKALQACSVLLVLLLRDGILPCEQEVLAIKTRYSLHQETGRAKSSRYIILLKVKRVCRLDQNTVSMALRRVFYSLSLCLIHAGYINQFEYCTC